MVRILWRWTENHKLRFSILLWMNSRTFHDTCNTWKKLVHIKLDWQRYWINPVAIVWYFLFYKIIHAFIKLRNCTLFMCSRSQWILNSLPLFLHFVRYTSTACFEQSHKTFSFYGPDGHSTLKALVVLYILVHIWSSMKLTEIEMENSLGSKFNGLRFLKGVKPVDLYRSWCLIVMPNVLWYGTCY